MVLIARADRCSCKAAWTRSSCVGGAGCGGTSCKIAQSESPTAPSHSRRSCQNRCSTRSSCPAPMTRGNDAESTRQGAVANALPTRGRTPSQTRCPRAAGRRCIRRRIAPDVLRLPTAPIAHSTSARANPHKSEARRSPVSECIDRSNRLASATLVCLFVLVFVLAGG